MPKRESMTDLQINNLKKAIAAVERQQNSTRSPSIWQSYEEELIYLRKKLGELLDEQ